MDFKRSKLGALLQLDESAFNSYKQSIKLKGRGSSYWRPATDAISEMNYHCFLHKSLFSNKELFLRLFVS